MPVADSFKEDAENKSLLKKAIAQNIRNYIVNILKEYSYSPPLAMVATPSGVPKRQRRNEAKAEWRT